MKHISDPKAPITITSGASTLPGSMRLALPALACALAAPHAALAVSTSVAASTAAEIMRVASQSGIAVPRQDKFLMMLLQAAPARLRTRKQIVDRHIACLKRPESDCESVSGCAWCESDYNARCYHVDKALYNEALRYCIPGGEVTDDLPPCNEYKSAKACDANKNCSYCAPPAEYEEGCYTMLVAKELQLSMHLMGECSKV